MISQIVPNVRRTEAMNVVPQGKMSWPQKMFWRMRALGSPGYVRPAQSVPGTVSMLPHRVTSYRRPAFWDPPMHFKRQEYLVSPPDLPGTAIPFTLFHPVYIPGLQGYQDVLPWNFAWAWGRHNFERFGSVQFLTQKAVVQRQNAWKPDMKVPQGPGTGRVWQQPRPYYVPNIINPGTR